MLRRAGPEGMSGRRLGAAILLLTAVVLLASAWLDDDAFVTLRTIANALDGHGLRWNPVERVQAYTHPLWLGLLTGLIAASGEYEVTTLLAAMALSLFTVYLLVFHVARSPAAGSALALALLLAKSYVDYATSGLEDPLTRLLLVVFVLLELRSPARSWSFGLLTLLAALAALSRPDALLVFLPALGLELVGREDRVRSVAAAACGLLPLLVWGLFALLYYGTPWPNTAYAKLGGGVPRAGVVVQGLAYLLDSLIRDPMTLVTLAVSTVVVLRRGDRRARALLAGGLLYLLYVVWIGGDYMSGRFLGLPLLAGVLALACTEPPPLSRRARVAALGIVCLLVVPRLVEPLVQPEVGIFGIGDERRVHHPYTGLLYAFGSGRWPDHPLRVLGEEARGKGVVHTDGAIGMLGFYAGPDVHIVDIFALADPLLARLPARVEATFNGPHRLGWRPGHLLRPIPQGYLESLPAAGNHIADPDLAAFYDVLLLVTRGPLWDGDRFRTIVRLNLGAYDHLVDSYVHRHSELFRP